MGLERQPVTLQRSNGMNVRGGELGMLWVRLDHGAPPDYERDV